MQCDNCGIKAEFNKLGSDDLGNMVLECQECGAVCYEDGTLIEEEVKIVKGKID